MHRAIANFVVLWGLVAAAVAVDQIPAPAHKPNIIVILTDDLG